MHRIQLPVHRRCLLATWETASSGNCIVTVTGIVQMEQMRGTAMHQVTFICDLVWSLTLLDSGIGHSMEDDFHLLLHLLNDDPLLEFIFIHSFRPFL